MSRSEQEILNALLNTTTGGLTQASLINSKIQGGVCYAFSHLSSIGANVSANVMIRNSSTKDLHSYFSFNCETNFNVYLYEAPSVSAVSVATAIASINLNRNYSANSLAATIYKEPSISAVSVANTLVNNYIPDGAVYLSNNVFGLHPNIEFVMKKSTDYLLRIINNASADRAYILNGTIYET